VRWRLGRPVGKIERTARNVFGWSSLRPGQLGAIRSVLDGADTLVVMPTGAGKSAIYQIAALLLGGPTVVVSRWSPSSVTRSSRWRRRGRPKRSRSTRPNPTATASMRGYKTLSLETVRERRLLTKARAAFG
jgi:hypothetical protein